MLSVNMTVVTGVCMVLFWEGWMLLSLKRVLWCMRESVKVFPLLSFPERSQTPSSLFPVILHILRCHVRAHAQNIRES